MKGHLQMVRRNDFASRPHPVPWRVSSNWGGDQLQCWAGSDKFPPKPECKCRGSLGFLARI
eukprot:COSAG04_NODE_1129_length_8137_cov_2.288007_3_plen_61_part_00